MIGISSYGIGLPYLRLPVEKTINCWKNSSLEFIRNTIGVKRRGVLDSDEDVLTLSSDSLREAIEMIDLNPNDIEAIILGSSTSPDLFKSNANQILSFFTDKSNYIGFDVQSSENSGMSALECGYALIKSNQVRNVVAIGADVLNRHIFPSELREAYMGAGAATILLSNEDTIADIIAISNSNSSFPEQSRPEDDRFIRVTAPLNSDVIEEGLMKRMCEAIDNVCKKADLKLQDIDYFAFNQNGSKLPLLISKKLNIDEEKVKHSIFSENTGDTGSAAALISLCVALNNIKKKDKKILVCGYGHSSGATAIIFNTTNLIEKVSNSNVNKKIENWKDISYEEAMKLEYKYIQPNTALNTFL